MSSNRWDKYYLPTADTIVYVSGKLAGRLSKPHTGTSILAFKIINYEVVSRPGSDKRSYGPTDEVGNPANPEESDLSNWKRLRPDRPALPDIPDDVDDGSSIPSTPKKHRGSRSSSGLTPFTPSTGSPRITRSAVSSAVNTPTPHRSVVPPAYVQASQNDHTEPKDDSTDLDE